MVLGASQFSLRYLPGVYLQASLSSFLSFAVTLLSAHSEVDLSGRCHGVESSL